MSRATENVAKSVLLGVVKTAGFFSGSVIKSKAGKKFFRLMPGEVALVSLDAFGEKTALLLLFYSYHHPPPNLSIFLTKVFIILDDT